MLREWRNYNKIYLTNNRYFILREELWVILLHFLYFHFSTYFYNVQILILDWEYNFFLNGWKLLSGFVFFFLYIFSVLETPLCSPLEKLSVQVIQNDKPFTYTHRYKYQKRFYPDQVLLSMRYESVNNAFIYSWVVEVDS